MRVIDQALESVVQEHVYLLIRESCTCDSGSFMSRTQHQRHLIEMLQDAWRQATLITHVDRLRAIRPPGIDSLNGPLVRAWPAMGAVFEQQVDGRWCDLDHPHQLPVEPQDVPLPAILLWEADETQPSATSAKPR